MAKILVIDDDPMMLRYARSLLESENYIVRTVASGAYALLEMQCPPLPEVILLDVIMPEMDGLETLRRILGIAPSAKVIMLSGQRDPAEIVRAMKLGASDYMAKPVDEQRLLDALRRYAPGVNQDEDPELIYEELGAETFFFRRIAGDEESVRASRANRPL